MVENILKMHKQKVNSYISQWPFEQLVLAVSISKTKPTAGPEFSSGTKKQMF